MPSNCKGKKKKKKVHLGIWENFQLDTDELAMSKSVIVSTAPEEPESAGFKLYHLDSSHGLLRKSCCAKLLKWASQIKQW